MAIRRKPNSVEEFINGGSTVPGTSAPIASESQESPEPPKAVKTEEETIAVTLRVPGDLLSEVDSSAKSRRPRRSRNSWILEAIVEKLEREKKSE